MNGILDHPQRYALANELHARPFPEVTAPGSAAYLAIRTKGISPDISRGHLLALLDRFGAVHPAGEAKHYYGQLGLYKLKWEMHSEFVTYTLFAETGSDQPFSGLLHKAYPAEWLADLTGEIITSVIIRMELGPDQAFTEERLNGEMRRWFVGESLAAAYVLDQQAVIAGDFRIDSDGHVRFVIMGIQGVGQRRLGRIVQRLLEVETYKSMAMLTLPMARKVFAEAEDLDRRLSDVVQAMTDGAQSAAQSLDQLLEVSAEVELLSSGSSFRFSAALAYRAIVDQRIIALREQRVLERQLFSEFMLRRFEPAMRTCEAAQKRLEDLSARAARAADLLSTRVGVDAAEQNRALLHRMDERAALQMRLQETVEGLSVVAISYYAVNLIAYILLPLLKPVLVEKSYLMAALVPPVMGLVWLLVRRIKARVATQQATK